MTRRAGLPQFPPMPAPNRRTPMAARSQPARPPPARQRPARPPSRLWPILRLGLILLIWAVLAGGCGLLWFARDLPRPEAALDTPRRPGLTLLDDRNHVFATFGDVVGDPLRLEDMPADLPAAVVAVEDRRFWWHHGFDFLGMARAAWVNLTSRRVVQGGSTLTQQVAKNLFLSNQRTFKRKIQEMMLTIWLEHHFTKAEILEIWLNRVYLGSGAWGMDAAAHLYFGVSARHVSLWQAAVLAGLPRAPSRINPRIDPQAAAARGREVLAAMAETGAITPEQAAQAAAQIHFPPAEGSGNWFADWVVTHNGDLIPPNTDAVLHTTLDPRLQQQAQLALGALLSSAGPKLDAGEGAVVMLDARSGTVRALVGGRNDHGGAFNRATAARRQPGSAFKPFVWLTALDRGMTPDSLVDASPVRIGHWSPSNYEAAFRGDVGQVTLQEALAQSLNTASVRLLEASGGPRAVIATARRLGITDKLPDDASLALGTGEVSLLELTTAYAAFFNGGLVVQPAAVTAVEADGRTTAPPTTPRPQVIDPTALAEMDQMLAAVVDHGTGRAAAIPGRRIMGKTGTTQNSRDAWFIGAVNGPMNGPMDSTVIGIWIGNDDDHPMRGVTGGSLPARLFHELAMQIAP